MRGKSRFQLIKLAWAAELSGVLGPGRNKQPSIQMIDLDLNLEPLKLGFGNVQLSSSNKTELINNFIVVNESLPCMQYAT